jgi:DinB family protein
MMSSMNAADEVRFPVGDFVIDPVVTDEKRRRWIAEMAQAPANLRVALAGLSDDQLDTRYRQGGWTLRQVVHHLADAWHGVHHTAHITRLREREGW